MSTSANFDAKAAAKAYLRRFKAIKEEMQVQGLDELTAKELAKDATKKSFEKETQIKNVPALTQFSQYTGETSPSSFLQTLEGELDLNNMNAEEIKAKYLPLLLKGRAGYFVDRLRTCATWAEKKEAFLREFTMDPNVVIGELRALRCTDYDVQKYTEQFNERAMKLNQADPGMEAQLKMLFCEGLPFKVKEYLIRERDYHLFSLQQAMAEANRHNNVSAYLNKGRTGGTIGGQYNNQGQNNQGENKQNDKQAVFKRRANYVASLWSECNMVISENKSNHVSSEQETFLTDKECKEISTYLEYLAVKSTLSSPERGLVLKATHALKDQLAREFKDQAAGTARGRQTARELLTEAERVLLRSAGGMSLLERLRRDETLREEMLSLLREFADTADEVQQIKRDGVQAQPIRRRRVSEIPDPIDVPMKEVPVQTRQYAVYQIEKAKGFNEYFGVHPELVEGAAYFGNSEQQQFLRDVTMTGNDLTEHQPITSNIPQVNVLIGGKYKARAVIDSGSTTTLISSGLLDKMPALRNQLKPTSLGFFGVAEQKLTYDGMLYDLELQLGDNLKTCTTVAVFPNKQCVVLLGNDLLGGPNAKFEIVMMNAMCSAYALMDKKGNTGIVHYIKNIEGATYPAPPVTNVANQPVGAAQVTQLFLG